MDDILNALLLEIDAAVGGLGAELQHGADYKYVIAQLNAYERLAAAVERILEMREQKRQLDKE